MQVKIGSQVGNWEVISDKFKKNGLHYNTCKCICGSIKDIRNWQLNHSMTKSCGCDNVKGRFKAKGVGELSLSYYNTFKRNRELKGKAFSDDVTIEFLWDLFLLQDRKCALSGIPITLNPRWSQQNKGRVTKIIQSASLDRIDNTKGYEITNVQWVHKDINLMKGSMREEVFINFCRLVSNMNKINDFTEVSDYSQWYGTHKNLGS